MRTGRNDIVWDFKGEIIEEVTFDRSGSQKQKPGLQRWSKRLYLLLSKVGRTQKQNMCCPEDGGRKGKVICAGDVISVCVSV